MKLLSKSDLILLMTFPALTKTGFKTGLDLKLCFHCQCLSRISVGDNLRQNRKWQRWITVTTMLALPALGDTTLIEILSDDFSSSYLNRF